MTEWNYTKDCMPDDVHLKWVAIHNNRSNHNNLDKAYYSPVTNKWYDESNYEMLPDETVYAWRDIEEPLLPVYKGSRSA